MKLKPVAFHWDLYALEAFQGTDGDNKQNSKMEKARIEKENKLYTGFVAQEVEKAATECGYDFSAIIRPTRPESTYHLSYAEFVVPLVKAIQEQQKQIEKQQQQIEQLMREVQRSP
ncbi:MAG: tail fiber domain-containing protein [Bacteroidales bacterium]